MAPEERARAPEAKAGERGPEARAPGARPSGEEAPPDVRAAERRIAVSFIVGTAAALALAGVYMAGGQPQAEGALLFVSLVSVGVGLVIWGRHLVGDEEVVDERRDLEATPEEREAFEAALSDDAGLFGRRKFLGRLLGGAVGALGLAALFPVRSLGPSPGDKLSHTAWHKGARVVDEEGRLMRADTVSVGGIRTIFPEGEAEAADAAAVLVRVAPDRLRPRKGREDWAPEGNLAYSKICPHVGCPVGLYVESTHELVCPCHQSTFDVLDGARPSFGPATRSLPQLPLAVDREGFLIAQADFDEPVG
ncbi:MAG TPA: Rieske 2Fe-2S domain-containing protein, partial [Acidimicrobiales bacterium]|nr:Rieske 2Fe-2S domain-containing protein [Acidimicrobiales bacterium]